MYINKEPEDFFAFYGEINWSGCTATTPCQCGSGSNCACGACRCSS